MPETSRSDDEHGAHPARTCSCCGCAVLRLPLPGPPPSPTRTPPSTAASATSTRRASASTRATRSTSGAPRATSRSCANAATARRRISIPSGSTPGPRAPGHAAARAPPPRARARPCAARWSASPATSSTPRTPTTRCCAGSPGPTEPGRFATWQDLCRECHGAGLEKRSPHAGDDRSCAFCHSAKPQPGQPATVTPAGRKLCEFCHGLKGEEHYAGVNPFKEPQECTGCHDPHLGKDHPARLKAGYFDPIRDTVTLNPHRKRTLCFACHADGKSGPLRGADVVALCQRCHGSGKIPGMSHPMTKVPAGYTIPAGVAARRRGA